MAITRDKFRFHMIAIVKMIVIGIFSGLSDLFSCVILWRGLCRFDYQFIMLFMHIKNSKVSLKMGLGVRKI
jgi:hypothetical protein